MSHFLSGIFLFLVAILLLMACHKLLLVLLRRGSGEEQAK
jgi:hypothetical protein